MFDRFRLRFAGRHRPSHAIPARAEAESSGLRCEPEGEMIIGKSRPITTQESAAIQLRFDWVDNAKALLIFLVVLGHFNYAAVAGRSVIYAFHVPAFLIITGFLMPTPLHSGPTRC
jgi:hypothetical protein